MWSLSHSAATVSTGKGESGGEPVGRCSDGKQAAGCDGGYGERAAGCDEAMSSKFIGCEAAMFAARRRKRQRRSFVLFAEFDLYREFVSES